MIISCEDATAQNRITILEFFGLKKAVRENGFFCGVRGGIFSKINFQLYN